MQRPPYTRATGSIALVQRKRGPVYYAKLRLPDGRQLQRKLGPAKNGRGRPPAGALTGKMAEDRLRELLVEAERTIRPLHGLRGPSRRGTIDDARPRRRCRHQRVHPRHDGPSRAERHQSVA
jgi:hypothetical protein